LPALDLPISRTGLLVYHPPLFKVTPEQGAFRVEAYANPTSAALNPPISFNGSVGAFSTGVGGVPQPAPPPAPSLVVDGKDEPNAKRAQSAAQLVLDKFRADAIAGRRAGILPIRVTFPAFGPSLYLVSELTVENQTPTANLTYQHEKKAGGK
jgi:hypothetical protein